MSRVTTRSAVRTIGQQANQPRVFRAYLAEDYDGIGQYVSLTLSQGAAAIGLRGRIGSGDFGTGQVVPVGTPVSVFSNRGNLEILSMGAK